MKIILFILLLLLPVFTFAQVDDVTRIVASDFNGFDTTTVNRATNSVINNWNMTDSAKNLTAVWSIAITKTSHSSGVWQQDIYIVNTYTTGSTNGVGIIRNDYLTLNQYLGFDAHSYCYYMSGTTGSKINNNVPGGAYGAAYGAGDVINIIVDFNALTVTCYKNWNWSAAPGVMYSIPSGTYLIAVSSMTQATAPFPTYILLPNSGAIPSHQLAPQW